MKHLFLACCLIFSSVPVWAQNAGDEGGLDIPGGQNSTGAPRARRVVNWVLGGSIMQWSEQMRFRQAGITNRSVANFNATILQASREFTFYQWGWSIGGFVGSGKANGDSPGTYEEGSLVFSVLGGQMRGFYRVNGRVNIGVTALMFNRNLAWPEVTGITAESGKNPNVTAVADVNLRLFKNWDFYQGIGPMAEGTTLWRLGVNFRY